METDTIKWTQEPISRTVFPPKFNFDGKMILVWFRSVVYHFATQCCTRRDSISGMACAKLHSDYFITTCVRAAWKFHRICSTMETLPVTSQWRHDGHDSVSNHQPHDCLLNRYSGTHQKKHQSSASLTFTGTDEFPAQMASNADNVSIWWRHHENGPLNHNLCLEHVWILEMHITLCSVRVYTKTAKCHRLFTTLNLLMRYNLTYNIIHSLSWSKKYANCMKNWRQLRSLGNWKSQKYKVIMR